MSDKPIIDQIIALSNDIKREERETGNIPNMIPLKSDDIRDCASQPLHDVIYRVYELTKEEIEAEIAKALEPVKVDDLTHPKFRKAIPDAMRCPRCQICGAPQGSCSCVTQP